MKTWIVKSKADGSEVFRYDAPVPVEWDGMAFATHDHVAEADAPAEAPVQTVRHITKLAFRNRFTNSEKAALELAGADVPTAPLSQRGQAATLRAYMADVDVAQYIDLNRPDTRAGVQMLEAFGLIGKGRAAVILDAEPTALEVWRA